MKVAEYVANFIADLGITHTFGVVGGGAMYLNDAFGNHPKMKFIPNHHEQASAMAAEAYARINGIGCCLVTTGPGGTNAITGVACAWVDSIPLIVISGQVTTDTLMAGHDVRQYGVQESDIVTMVESITKSAVRITNANNIRDELERAAYLAISGRPGPVWLDIPLDIQNKEIDPSKLLSHYPIPRPFAKESPYLQQVIAMLQEAKRPVLIVGNGARHADIDLLIHHLEIPVVSSWGAADIVADDKYHIGHCGLFGDRASNFSVQNADLLLVIGCRLSIPMIGHNTKAFAPNAKIIMVDIDSAELDKSSLHVDLKINEDVNVFCDALINELVRIEWWQTGEWVEKCLELQEKYPVIDEHKEDSQYINSFHFINKLSELLPDDAVVVTDAGTAYTCTFQAAKMKKGQRWIYAHGHAPMGYALPAAIGAHFATGNKVICIVGDGGLQMNIQELATIRQFNLPIIIFVLNNGGYLTIKHSQDNNFNRRVGADGRSGIGFPALSYIATAYGIGFRVQNDLVNFTVLTMQSYPLIIEIKMNPDQALIPVVKSIKNLDGSISGGSLGKMYPFLSEHINAND